MSAEDVKALEHQLLKLAPGIDAYFNPDEDKPRQIGFLICAFEFEHAGDGDALAFLSNANKQDLVVALQELIRKMDTSYRIVTPSQEQPS